MGLEKYGQGDWRSISRNAVKTRTPTQVASHAQKYFSRLKGKKKERKRSSIHDIKNPTATSTLNQYNSNNNEDHLQLAAAAAAPSADHHVQHPNLDDLIGGGSFPTLGDF